MAQNPKSNVVPVEPDDAERERQKAERQKYLDERRVAHAADMEQKIGQMTARYVRYMAEDGTGFNIALSEDEAQALDGPLTKILKARQK
jgi:hypothetical protein